MTDLVDSKRKMLQSFMHLAKTVIVQIGIGQRKCGAAQPVVPVTILLHKAPMTQGRQCVVKRCLVKAKVGGEPVELASVRPDLTETLKRQESLVYATDQTLPAHSPSQLPNLRAAARFHRTER